MKVITFPLVGGHTATFFLGKQNLVVCETDNPKECVIIDGMHNNGGWKIAQSPAAVVNTLVKALG